ncbi:MAG: CBS domain-containing protein [Candidatus Odinarchaeota archaeon]
MQISPEYLKRLRKEKKWTQEELAKHTSISQAHIAKIESGVTDPRLSTVNKLLKALTEDLVGEKENCQSIMSKNIVFCNPDDTLAEASVKMLKFGYSMLPVFNEAATGKIEIAGNLTEKVLYQVLLEKKDPSMIKVREVMEEPLPQASIDSQIDEIPTMMQGKGGILVVDHEQQPVGIITRADLFKTILP